MEKKPYSPPTLTDLGDAVQKTKGLCGPCWEMYGSSYGPVGPIEN
jgi:hypothetical protein